MLSKETAGFVGWTEVGQPAGTGSFLSIAFGDINNDAKLDLIGGTLTQGVWATAGDGAGNWTPFGALTNTGGYNEIALGDINNDGLLDVVGAENESGIHIWLGNGSGDWTTVTSPTSTGQYWSVALGDINNDGNLDIAAGSGDSSGLSVWFGDGTGDGWTSISGSLPSGGNFTGLTLGDFNGDSSLDLVAGSQGGGILAWTGDGDGSWVDSANGLPISGIYHSVRLGDLDDDGDLDIVGCGNATGIKAWKRESDGSWQTASEGLPKSINTWEISLGDINNDGNLDIVASHFDGGITVWTGNGSGTWSDASATLPATGDFRGVQLGDFNNDGKLDIAAGIGSGEGARAWQNTGSYIGFGSWHAHPRPDPQPDMFAVSLDDMNNDGKMDIAAASDGNGVLIWRGDGGYTWTRLGGGELPDVDQWQAVTWGQIDHRNNQDLVAALTGGGIKAWLLSEDGTAFDDISTGLPDSGDYRSLTLADLNHDGLLDLIAAGMSQGVRVWETTGTGFTPAEIVDSAGDYCDLEIGHINHDGNLDIIAANCSGGGVAVWLGDGSLNFASATSPAPNGNFAAVALSDINQDGYVDAIAAEEGNGIAIWAGDGGSNWESSGVANPPSLLSFLALDVGDFDLDGQYDLLAAAKSDGLRVWRGDGGSSWTSASTNLPTSGTYFDAEFGKVDGDANLDIIAAEGVASGIHVWTAGESVPGGWRDFQPPSHLWTTEQQPDCSVQVVDVGSGLNVDSAQYRISRDGGDNWDDWHPATISGTNGTNEPQRIVATAVPFDQDSADQNVIQFFIENMSGFGEQSPVYTVAVDATPPQNPSNLNVTSHTSGVWSATTGITAEWNDAIDPTSGPNRYYYEVTNSSATIPDASSMYTPGNLGTDYADSDGQNWYFHLVTTDLAGNWATGAVHDGPFWIDRTPPGNPGTLLSNSHTIHVWSNESAINTQWTASSDGAGSGIARYWYSWSRGEMDNPRDYSTNDLSVVDYHLSSGDNWIFNLQAEDNVGRTSETQHLGPFYIDLIAPVAWINLSSHVANQNPFTVRWNGLDNESGVDTYEVQSSEDGTNWDDWLSMTYRQSAEFLGERGQTYYFRVRAHDHAGNAGEWSDSFDITVGVSMTVLVEDEWGTPLDGAVVFLDGEEQGATSADGTLIVPYALINDTLAAKYLLFQFGSRKSQHEWPYDENWSYRVYKTNVDFDDIGRPQLHTVTGPHTTQVLVVRRDNSLIGFHVLVSIEWDADDTYLQEVLTGFQNASNYLFDLTDGQMLFEAIEIVDNKSSWENADYHIHASNNEWPRARVGGIYRGTGAHVQLGRYFDGLTSNTGTWDLSNGFRTMIHEFGHYGLSLYDEYLNRDGAKDALAGCTTDRETTPEPFQASFMAKQFTATEMCSTLDAHPHNTNTFQHEMHEEPCWNTVDGYFGSSTGRWLIETPEDRGSVMPGPTRIPIDDWMYFSITDADTHVCPPFNTEWMYPSVWPVWNADVWVENGRIIQQGRTLEDGTLTIFGAHNGDIVRLSIECGPECNWSDEITATCTDSLTHTRSISEHIVSQDPFSFAFNIAPSDNGNVLEIQVESSTVLNTPPQLNVWQDGATNAIAVELEPASSSNIYLGTVTLNDNLGQKGMLWSQGTDMEGNTVTKLAPFIIENITFEEQAWLRSDDGLLELFLKPHTLSEDSAVNIMADQNIVTAQDNLVLASKAYKINVFSGEQDLDIPATLNLYYHDEMLDMIDIDTLQIYQWDPNAKLWLNLGGVIDTQYNLVSTTVNDLSTFAILGVRADSRRIYLPIIVR